jgi:hypothetical protein
MKHIQIHPCASAALLAVLLVAAARADVFIPLASYEPAERDLSVIPNAGDPGLNLALVPGGGGGVPAATDGEHVLRVTISNEADRKVEFAHEWNSTWYDLGGNAELLIDLYIATSGARPGVFGVYDGGWSPPSAWQPAASLPTVGSWQTIAIPLQNRQQANLARLHALVFENLAGTSGTLYVDNLRFRRPGPPPAPTGVAANGYAHENLVVWKPSRIAPLDGYHVYRSLNVIGPYARVTGEPTRESEYRDTDILVGTRYYYTVSVVSAGVESAQSLFTYARYDGLSDEALLDLVQAQTFRYFWDGAHPYCGLAREGLNFGHPLDTVTIGGTGFGLMTIVVAAERGFVTRTQAAARILRIVRFLDGRNPDNPALPSGVQRYHGAWAHHYNGYTGATIPFSGPADNGADLVETGFLVQGLLTVRQYFDDVGDLVESEIRQRCTSMWESVEWDWYRRVPNGSVLYWHWSPDYGWAMNLPIRGYNETQIIYVLAVASPTHPVPASVYHTGFAGLSDYENGRVYFDQTQFVGPPMGGPLFFTHYSNLGLDPRYRRDAYANYFENARNTSRINRAYCIENRYDFAGYSPLSWGITASADPAGYDAHSPTNDNGTLAPTAALSAMPYTPHESLAALRHLYDFYGASLWGPYGFYDAINRQQNWVGQGYLAIDQGPIAPMIENYRSGLCWRLFMSNPEIVPALEAIGFRYEVDFDADGDIDATDLAIFAAALAGPEVATAPPGVTADQFGAADLDLDSDVDLHDVAVFQQLCAGP